MKRECVHAWIVHDLELDENLARFLRLCVQAVEEGRDLDVWIASDGGSDAAMYAYLAGIRSVREAGRVVRTTGVGKVASAAVALLAAGTPGERRVARDCEVLIHMGSISLPGERSLPRIKGDARRYEEYCRQYLKTMRRLTGRRWELEYDRDYCYRGKDVLALGIADVLL